MKGKTGSVSEDVDARVVAIRARLRETYERAYTEPFGLDEIDTEVVIDLFDAAMDEGASALFALHPEFNDLDDAELEDAVTALDDRYATERTRPKDDPREDIEFVAVLVALSAVGVTQIVHSWRNRGVAREVTEAMENVIELMCFVGYVLAPSNAAEAPEELGPADRIRQAARLEQYELALEEARARARVCMDPFSLGS